VINPTELAIAKIGETKRHLEALIMSSESFDYRRAKKALVELQKMLKELGRLEKTLRATRPQPPNVCVVEFGGPPARNTRP
jgi:hypothetical protein